MMEIVAYPDPVLMTQCRTITDEEIASGFVDGRSIAEIASQMTDLLRSTSNGIGLAAPQVGLPIRLFIVDLDRDESPMVLINPVVSNLRGSAVEKEGCLSLPDIEVHVKRPASVTVSGIAYKAGKPTPTSFEAEGMLARVAQHERDHLDGSLIIHKTGIVGARTIRKQLESMERRYAARQQAALTKAQAEKKTATRTP